MLGVGEVGGPADRPVLGDRLGVVGEGAIGGRRGGLDHLLDAGIGGGLEDGLGAVDVDVVHLRLVADRIEDEGEVEERVDLMPLEQLAHLVAVADVGLDELVLLPGARRRPKVDVDDLLGLLAGGELVGEPAADVARSRL